ncbi:MAG: winged helix-turn-helix transcriptional regulator [Candidatus Aenigmarchaeota archaeon]|nr:winged helix-turn-helix transcriptional regulator [Candidatus Aenigmarchaeota archaeon]
MGEKSGGKVIISEDLLKIKDMIGRPRKIKIRDSREEVLIQLKELGYKIEVMEKNKKETDKSIAPKRKKQIIFLLKDRKLISPDVGRALGISRSRANEYLKFMEDEGILRSEKRGRKKFYTLKEGFSCEK